MNAAVSTTWQQSCNDGGEAPATTQGRFRPRPLPCTTTDPQDFRDYVADALGIVILHAEIAQRFAGMGDDAGLEYALSGMIGATRCARDVFRDIRPADDGEATR